MARTPITEIRRATPEPDEQRGKRRDRCVRKTQPPETGEFLALYDELAKLNQMLLAYLEDLASRPCTPAVTPFLKEISMRASRIRERMSRMETLAEELKENSALLSGKAAGHNA